MILDMHRRNAHYGRLDLIVNIREPVFESVIDEDTVLTHSVEGKLLLGPRKAWLDPACTMSISKVKRGESVEFGCQNFGTK